MYFTYVLKRIGCLALSNVLVILLKILPKREFFYLALVASQFNHCSSIWRPSSLSLLNKIERVQIRGIKWILSEQYTTYTANNYFGKCKELNLLPLRLRLDFFAILLFHKIVHKTVPIELPAYIALAPETNLRSSHRDPLTFLSSIKPRITKKVPHNRKQLKTRSRNVKTVKTKVKKIMRKKKKPFKKYRARENIYIDDNSMSDDFSENKVLTTSFFLQNTYPAEQFTP